MIVRKGERATRVPRAYTRSTGLGLLMGCLTSVGAVANASRAEDTAGQDNEAAQQRVTTKIEAIGDKFGVPALIAGKFHASGRQLTAATGVRKVGSDARVTLKDTIHLGSCTKAMTALLIAQDVTAGTLRWDMTLSEALPGVADLAESDWAALTLADLMRHRSGAPANAPWQRIDREFPDDPVGGRGAVLKWLLNQPRPAETDYLYSNVGYALLGHIVEVHAQVPWESVMLGRLFEPLEISGAGFGPVVGPSPLDQPWGHVVRRTPQQMLSDLLRRATGEAVVDQYHPLQLDNPAPLGPAGRVHMPLEQWAKFVALFASDAGPDERLKIDAVNWQELLSTGGEGNYAGGWIMTQRHWAAGTVLTHAGSNTTWYCVAWVAPKKNYCVLAATNCYGDAAITACDQAVAALIELD